MATLMHEEKGDFAEPENQRIEQLKDAEKMSNSSRELEAQQLELDEQEAARVLRKVDWRLVPVLALLYLVAFIDRSNSMSFSSSFVLLLHSHSVPGPARTS